MEYAGLKNVIAFIKKTGDKCVILDENGQDAYVIMPLSMYEDGNAYPATQTAKKSLKQEPKVDDDLTGPELLNKINRDIAVWKSIQDTPFDSEIPQHASKREIQQEQAVHPHVPIVDADADKDAEPTQQDEGDYYFEPVDDESK